MAVIRQDAAKFIYFGETKINLETDTITSSDDIVAGKIGHLRDGSVVEGTNTNDVDSTDITTGKAAGAGDILDGQEAYVNGVKLVGSMPNRGAVTGEIHTKTGLYTIPAGKHDGSGTVGIASAEQDKIIAGNIKKDITILGVTGTLEGATTVTAQSKSATPTNSQQVITPDSGYDYLSQVTIAAVPYSETTGTTGGTIITIGGTA